MPRVFAPGAQPLLPSWILNSKRQAQGIFALRFFFEKGKKTLDKRILHRYNKHVLFEPPV